MWFRCAAPWGAFWCAVTSDVFNAAVLRPVEVIVPKVERSSWVDTFTTAPAVDLACLNPWHPLGAFLLMLRSIPTLAGGAFGWHRSPWLCAAARRGCPADGRHGPVRRCCPDPADPVAPAPPPIMGYGASRAASALRRARMALSERTGPTVVPYKVVGMAAMTARVNGGTLLGSDR